GVLERHPSLKILLARLGGAITTCAGRIDHGWECRHGRAHVPPWGRDLIPKKPSEYLKKMYVDTQTFHPPAIMCAVETLGVDHVLLGSDFPPVPRSLKLTVEDVRGLPISDGDKARILGGNAEKLFKYESA
ncbi:MAG: amidohydrolase, partial [Chloroflexi bacterium]|nr:amidohydrolase [Chloroflexota bacterium]